MNYLEYTQLHIFSLNSLFFSFFLCVFLPLLFYVFHSSIFPTSSFVLLPLFFIVSALFFLLFICLTLGCWHYWW